MSAYTSILMQTGQVLHSTEPLNDLVARVEASREMEKIGMPLVRTQIILNFESGAKRLAEGVFNPFLVQAIVESMDDPEAT